MVCQKFLIQCFKLFFVWLKIVCKHTKWGMRGLERTLQSVGLFWKSFNNKLSETHETNSSFIFREYRFNICLPRHFLSLKRESNNYAHASLIRTFLTTFTLSCQFIEVKNIVTLKFFLKSNQWNENSVITRRGIKLYFNYTRMLRRVDATL